MAGTIKQHVGRVREKLSERLAEVGIDVHPADLLSTMGGERQCDCARWETIDARKDGEPAHVHSFSTMTACARYGVVLTDDDMWNWFEANDKEPVRKTDG